MLYLQDSGGKETQTSASWKQPEDVSDTWAEEQFTGSDFSSSPTLQVSIYCTQHWTALEHTALSLNSSRGGQHHRVNISFLKGTIQPQCNSQVFPQSKDVNVNQSWYQSFVAHIYDKIQLEFTFSSSLISFFFITVWKNPNQSINLRS